MLNTQQIEAFLRGHCLATDVKVMPRGHVRVGTKLLYLDGSGIDVFVDATQTSTTGGLLSDFGQTMANLAEHQVKYQERLDVVRQIVKPLAVGVVRDRLVLQFRDEGELSQAVYDLAQACARVSCVALTRSDLPHEKWTRS